MFAIALALWGCSGSSPMAAESSSAAEAPAPEVHTAKITSETYRIDKMYGSMRGPYGFDDVTLGSPEQPELVWIVGYKTTVVDANTGSPMSQEYMCHANLDMPTKEYFEDFPTSPSISGRVFTLSQGQQDIRFPPGMGIPVQSDMKLSLVTQVLNLNHAQIKMDVKHEVEVYFVKDSEVGRPMVPLYQAAAEGFKALGDALYYGLEQDEADPDEHGAGCSVGQAAVAGDSDDDTHGQKFTAHWVVPPGREVNRTNATRFLNLPYDTKAYYIAIHLHSFAESLELVDLTDGKSVFKALAKPSEGRVGIDHIDHYESTEGIQLYKDHEYEIVSVYNNTTEIDHDAMAVMYLYLENKTFKKPQL
ncbi:MAG: hypothetical protein H0V89_14775 [Deltaproteobacteria bacterium]|nr:hypothetical protein [Deltaproteobacteria bacterium]